MDMVSGMNSEEQWQIDGYCECGAIIWEMDGEYRSPGCICNRMDTLVENINLSARKIYKIDRTPARVIINELRRN